MVSLPESAVDRVAATGRLQVTVGLSEQVRTGDQVRRRRLRPHQE